MIIIKNKAAIRKMEEAGKRLATIFDELASQVVPGVTTAAIDSWIEQRLYDQGMVPRTKGYMGYKHASCISINDEIVHGVPSDRRVADGDLVSIDVVASLKGYCADMARSIEVGSVAVDVKNIHAAAQSALDKGIAKACPGNYLTDISAAIQADVESKGFSVVRDFAGHGIGKQMHEDPEILNYGTSGQGPKLQPGMTFALEPMITAGSYETVIDSSDGWTVRTKDSSLAAHVEDTIVITEHKPKILTRVEV